jgi:DNA modification methylase
VEKTTSSVSLYRPVLLFAKRQYRFDLGFRDSVAASSREEKCHPFQQDLEATKALMRQVLRPKAMVCDPCLGSGTFLLALHALNQEKRLGCKFVGCDVDADCIKMALHRIR